MGHSKYRQDGHAPRKRFGQNFLHDPHIIHRIVQSISPQQGETVVEIGPGLGAITEPLLKLCGAMQIVELDRDLVPKLAERLGPLGEVAIHQADALKFDFASIRQGDQPLRVVGNLPYNISTPLIFHLLSYAGLIKDMHFMLQKEVVDRLAASPGTSDYGRLSVMVQYRCAVTKLIDVGPGAFNPPPKVDSAVVRIAPYLELPFPVDSESDLAELVSSAFGQRRKTLRNNLKHLMDDADYAALGIDPSIRAERLTVEQLTQLANQLSDKRRAQ
ncbi:16S rRNA (adenine(1518)-N(6)/adenine(1519)-N(6))-dimethyltransferase [Solemya pervernicosa gill symbiont]|uniref:Ribosomal RNA small subunit methyltransferase A n=2 Tax=Gammaproteobacteria incertae sedis TaxID=118884 RepID=A0A1T2L4J4_9GAMM|nr:16S rRNA (adenine(1518)-N(6)/adenine(1519)-N(6))-dimethyltransferase RsmA [Candidatus Reidiella endopervernicosa]OOZ39960.1 16S rRNA (adenine(1518)-N(6)/adenine(1519)-N(6))-dimethyltransferase [Solemya pervernicosa gill symbiont]QKQ25938.1 16S rRNA (adenine(1518)-N(6)/adenine(1519)-N(6))-dimethyltransferase RsmA [Candidatus Reidiella endopervernicosa]